jgi:hypothetical protein
VRLEHGTVGERGGGGREDARLWRVVIGMEVVVVFGRVVRWV